MVNSRKCPHFPVAISILVGGNYDLLRNTQNTNGAVLKEMEVTDLQPQGVTSKYWCRKDFQFRKAVETQHELMAPTVHAVENPCVIYIWPSLYILHTQFTVVQESTVYDTHTTSKQPITKK